MSALPALAAEIRSWGGLLAEAVVDPGPDGPPPGEHELVAEAVREGELLHYGSARVVSQEDPDLALLAGDALYALGLARLAAIGDLAGVRVLADVISDCAQAHAEGRGADAVAIWERGAAQLGAQGDL